MGISLSSLDKMRSGTRTGQGSVKRRVIDRPKRHDGRPQTVKNEFNISFKSADGKRSASRNIYVEGAFTQADALVLAHDPKIRRALIKQLEAEEKSEARRITGSPVWKRKERASLVVQEVTRVVYADKPGFYIHSTRLQ
jgi:hypothetical protein